MLELEHAAASQREHDLARTAACLHRPRGRRLPSDAATDASVGHDQGPSAPPSARHSCARRVTAIRCNSSSAEHCDRRALRLAPSHPYKPQSASLLGLAPKNWRSWMHIIHYLTFI